MHRIAKFAALFPLLLLDNSRAADAPRHRAFVDVSVVDVEQGRVIPGQAVIITDGRISWVGDAGRASIPAGALRVPGQSRFLVPGLSDMHAHLDEDDLPLLLASGVTLVREMNGAPRHLAWRREIAGGTRVGPTMIVAGPLLAGTAQRYRHVVLSTPDQATALVTALADSGYDFIKAYDDLAQPVYQALMAAAAARRIPVSGHISRFVGLDGVLAQGQRSIEHVEQVLNAVGGHRADTAAVDSAMRAIAASSTWVTPTLAVMEALTLTSSPPVWQRFDGPEMLYVDSDTRAWWNSLRRGDRPAGASPRAVAYYALFQRLARNLHQMNVSFLVGTDTPNPLMVPGFSVHLELAALEEAGIPRPVILRAATAGAARFLGTPEEFGTIRPGGRADLILVGGNPLENLNALARPEGVMARGEWLPRERLDQMMEQVRKKRAPTGQ
jgi:imidazolonepropionase-like amidohydrolase